MIDRRIFLGSGTAVAAFALATGLGGRAMAAETFPYTLTDEEWRAKLTPDQYLILREAATEAQNSSPLQEEFRDGTYHCVGCGEAIFSSDTKFPSDTGWPAFSYGIEGGIGTGPDKVYGALLTEVHCANCGSHHAHIFNDGPEPLGTRYCANGLVLDFRPQSA